MLSRRVYNKRIEGIDCGEEANQWFQTFLGNPKIQLIQHHPKLEYRPTNSDERFSQEEKYPIIYQNKAGLHIVNEASIRDLNRKFKSESEPATEGNFRPNVLFDDG